MIVTEGLSDDDLARREIVDVEPDAEGVAEDDVEDARPSPIFVPSPSFLESEVDLLIGVDCPCDTDGTCE